MQDIMSMPSDKLMEVLPKLGIQLGLSALCKANATRRNGVPSWQVNRFIEDSIQSLAVNQTNQSTGFLPILQQLMQQQPIVQTPVKDDKLDQISKSLHALHKRNDAIDEALKKINKICEIK